MYNRQNFRGIVVNFLTVPDFYEKNGSAGPANFFGPEKKSGFFLFARKNIRAGNNMQAAHGILFPVFFSSCNQVPLGTGLPAK